MRTRESEDRTTVYKCGLSGRNCGVAPDVMTASGCSLVYDGDCVRMSTPVTPVAC